MWNYIRRKLRLYEISEDNEFLRQHIQCCSDDLQRLEKAVLESAKLVRVQQQAIASILGKVEPILAAPEVPPTADAPQAEKDAWAARKSESDRIGQAALDRLAAEDWARRHTTGEE